MMFVFKLMLFDECYVIVYVMLCYGVIVYVIVMFVSFASYVSYVILQYLQS